MANIKDRKIYELSSFKGMDTENKLAKVEPYRASFGKNFIIDSDTIKTRPSFQLKRKLPFDLGVGEIVIGWHTYKGAVIYITNKYFYFDINEVVYRNDTISDNVFTSLATSFSFDGLNAIFREEKDALFVFGLNQIYVVGILSDNDGVPVRIIFYELDSKPINPYPNDEEDYDYSRFLEYEDLPSPYVPTVMLGDASFEDVNMLSKKRIYKLFSQSTDYNIGGHNIHYLPTDYDASKHGAFSYDVTFYDGEYTNFDVMPEFLGIEDEHFSGDEIQTITVINSNPKKIEETIFPTQEFEYYAAKSGGDYILDNGYYTEGALIKKVTGLTKNDFFNMHVMDLVTNMPITVFEYLMKFIKSGGVEGQTENVIYQFTVDIKAVTIIRDDITNYILQNSAINSVESVYVTLKRSQITNQEYFQDDAQGSTTTQVIDGSPDTWPAYPLATEYASADNNFDMGTSYNETLSLTDFQTSAENRIKTLSNWGQYADGTTFAVRGQYYHNYSQVQDAWYATFYELTAAAYVDSSTPYTWSSFESNVPYPSFANPPVVGDPILTEGDPYIYLLWAPETQDDRLFAIETNLSLTTFNYYTNAEWRANVEQLLKIFSNSLYVLDKNGFFRIRFTVYSTADQLYRNYSVIIRATLYDEVTVNIEDRRSFCLLAHAGATDVPIAVDFYSLAYNENKSQFELRVSDLMYDYRLEPSIKVEIKFTSNPNYNLIANNKFGISFGSEERLFLAGHEDFPNIDRYNASNDLLGEDFVNKSQSYELSYFPSKNYRVVGGKGAINGYVVATDTQLYITKSEYITDSNLFIRERVLDENGIAYYKEYKTNISKTPINDKCIVRFYNDILMLTKEGLYGIEISSNVLTNERLIKLRSGFINNSLIQSIKEFGTNDVFMLENNFYMYIFIGNDIYVADSRYTSTNVNSEIGNLSYEIIKWELPMSFTIGFLEDKKFTLLEEGYNNLYEIVEEGGYDELMQTFKASTGMYYINEIDKQFTGFVLSEDLQTQINTYGSDEVALQFQDLWWELADSNEYTYVSEDKKIIPNNTYNFRNVVVGDTLYFSDGSTTTSFTVTDYALDRTWFVIDIDIIDGYRIFQSLDEVPLYITYEFNYQYLGYPTDFVLLSKYRPENGSIKIEQGVSETYSDYLDRLLNTITGEATFMGDTLNDVDLYYVPKVEVLWVSGILDFQNDAIEKTIFKSMLYMSAQEDDNVVYTGFRTMRGLDRINEVSGLTVSNKYDLNQFNLYNFSLNTFDDVGYSMPMKVNNFLYIQVLLMAKGNVEINSWKFVFKHNRALKTIS